MGSSEPVLTETDFLGKIDAFNRAWKVGEKVLVYDGVSGSPLEYTVNGLTAEGDALLKGQVFNTSDLYCALYPASAFKGMTEGKAVFTVPSAQPLYSTDATSAAKVSPAVAMSQTKELDFVNVASYLVIDVKAGSVEAFAISAKDGANLSGTVTLSVLDGKVETSAGGKTVTMTAFDGVFDMGRYYVQVLPGAYSEGFTIDVDMTEDKELTFDIASVGEVKVGKTVFAASIVAPVEKPEVTVSEVAFSSAKLSWPADSKADGYNIYVNGQKVATLSADAEAYALTGLQTGAESVVEVEAFAELGTDKTQVKIKTAGVYEYEKSTGSSFLCIGWDAPARKEIHGTTQAYQIQVWADETMTTPVYDFVPEPGGNNSQSQLFGNGSYYGYTTQPQGPDSATSSNYLTPTRVSVGGFYPNTTYYVRVRTLASFTQENGVVLSHPFGDSQWSELIPMTTDAAHVPSADEIIYCGFDDMCVQHDFLNSCLGAINKNKGDAIAWDKRPSQLFYFYHNNQNYHQASTFGLASSGKRADGTSALPDYSSCAIHVGNQAGTGNTYIGDTKGWTWAAWTRPLMGAIATEGKTTFVASPVLDSDKLSEDGTECSLSFKASLRIRISDEYVGTDDALAVQVWRAATSSYETVKVFKTSEILPFDVAVDTSKEVLNDYGRNTLNCDLTLHRGDNVEIVAMRGGNIILDDILVVRK